MKTRFLVAGSLLFLIFLATACGGQAGAASPEAAQLPETANPADLASVPVMDFASLMDVLRAGGGSVELAETVQQPFFNVEGQIIKVNGEDVQVFEYETAEAMEADAAQVSEDGGSIGTSMVSWMSTPHFYKAGSILVLYVGDDQAVLALLEGALGSQFAGR